MIIDHIRRIGTPRQCSGRKFLISLLGPSELGLIVRKMPKEYGNTPLFIYNRPQHIHPHLPTRLLEKKNKEKTKKKQRKNKEKTKKNQKKQKTKKSNATIV